MEIVEKVVKGYWEWCGSFGSLSVGTIQKLLKTFCGKRNTNFLINIIYFSLLDSDWLKTVPIKN